MVRNYIKKRSEQPKYSTEKLERALDEIRARTLTIHKASVVYNIPFSTLYCRSKGLRGSVKKSKGRSTALSQDVENTLATSVKTLARWGFGLTRKEIMELVGQYVNTNNLSTPFKDGVPGEDWFLNFKRRHHLSIRKPESLEYARKKATTDPFVIHGYFDLLKKTLSELDLEYKPERIWNLDESNLSIDPSRTRLVGEKGKSSSRVTSTSGRDNTTFVLAANAAGRRVPPLIIYKGKNMWDQWRAPPENEFPGTAYAASPNGWMETELFKNYFLKTLIPALGEERPALVVYDGHSTHISVDIVETALAHDITILKIPAHTSHLLQPLDLSVFKSFKNKWDAMVTTWQRQHIGQKLPKSLFSQYLGDTWTKVSEDVIKSGFTKGGIHPFNPNVIPEQNFSQESLQRWREHKQKQLRNEINEDNIVQVENETPETERPATQEVSVNNSILSAPSTSRDPDPQSPDVQTSRKISIEDIILSTIHQKNMPPKQRKRKVASGAEVITSAEFLEVLKNKDKKRKHKNDNEKPVRSVKGKKRKVDLDSDSTDSGESVTEIQYAESDQSERFEEEEIEELLYEEDINDEEDQNKVSANLDINKWVVVKYSLKKSLRYYVGLVQKKVNDSLWEVKFVRRRESMFVWPEVEDLDTVTASCVEKILPDPKINKRGMIHFDFNFQNIIVS